MICLMNYIGDVKLWIRGYKLKPGVVPPYVICDEIKRLARISAYEHGADWL
jgi:hypothetical protein